MRGLSVPASVCLVPVSVCFGNANAVKFAGTLLRRRVRQTRHRLELSTSRVATIQGQIFYNLLCQTHQLLRNDFARSSYNVRLAKAQGESKASMWTCYL